MADRFEARLDDLFRAYAAQGVRPIDRRAIATAVISSPRVGGWSRQMWRPVRVALVLVLLVASALAALWIAGRMQPPPELPRVYRNELVAAPDLLDPRKQPIAVTLSDGRVLIVGGNNSTVKDSEVFDPMTGRRVRAGQLMGDGDFFAPGPVAAALLSDGSVLVIGASLDAGLGEHVSPQRFDPDRLAFHAVGQTVLPRIGPSLTGLLDGRVLVMGGTDPDTEVDNTVIATAELFDPVTEQFSLTGSAPDGRLRSDGLLLRDGRVLFIAVEGFTGDILNSLELKMVIELYDPGTGSFSDAAVGSGTGPGRVPVLLEDGRVLILGGRGGLMPVVTAQIWDGSRILTASPPPVGVHTATLLDDGRVFATGALRGRGNWVGVYSPAADTWIPFTGSKGYEPAVTKLLDGRILLVGGLEDGETHDIEGGGHDAPPIAAMEYFE